MFVSHNCQPPKIECHIYTCRNWNVVSFVLNQLHRTEVHVCRHRCCFICSNDRTRFRHTHSDKSQRHTDRMYCMCLCLSAHVTHYIANDVVNLCLNFFCGSIALFFLFTSKRFHINCFMVKQAIVSFYRLQDAFVLLCVFCVA